MHSESPSSQETKRNLIAGSMSGWGLPQMAAFARRIVLEYDLVHLEVELNEFIGLYDAGGGVTDPTKNLFFAARRPEAAD